MFGDEFNTCALLITFLKLIRPGNDQAFIAIEFLAVAPILIAFADKPCIHLGGEYYMFRKITLGLGLILAGALVIAAFFLPPYLESTMNKVQPHAPYPISEETAALHKTLIVGDLHSDSLLWNRDLAKRSKLGHVDIPRLQEGNVFIQIFRRLPNHQRVRTTHPTPARATISPF